MLNYKQNIQRLTNYEVENHLSSGAYSLLFISFNGSNFCTVVVEYNNPKIPPAISLLRALLLGMSGGR